MARVRRKNHEGSIYRRKDGRWVGNLSIGYDAKGKRIRLDVYGRTKDEVEQKLLEARPALQEGLDPKASKFTVAEYLDRWLEHGLKNKWRENTYFSYSGMVKCHVKPYIGSVLIGSLTTTQMQSYIAALEHAGVSPWRRQRVYCLLHKAFRDAYEWKIIYRFPMHGMRQPKAPPTTTMRVFSREESERFIEVAKGERMGAMFVLAILTGMRLGELLGLFWEDIDFQAGKLSVRRACTEVRKIPRIGPPKTESSKRAIELPEMALEALKMHRERQIRVGLDVPLVFPNADGYPLLQSNFHTYHWKPLLLKAGLPLIRFHDLRHTHATEALKHAHPKVVQERLGHKRMETTLETYAHVLPTMQKDLAKKLDEVFGHEGHPATIRPAHDEAAEAGLKDEITDEAKAEIS